MNPIISWVVLGVCVVSLLLNLVQLMLWLRLKKRPAYKEEQDIADELYEDAFVMNTSEREEFEPTFSEEKTRTVSPSEIIQPVPQPIVEMPVLEPETTAKILTNNGPVDIGYSSVIGSRPYQQDALKTAMFGGSENGKCQCAIGVLCDGMGGMEGGEIASNIAVNRMIEYAQSVVRDYPVFFKTSIEKINKEVTELCDENGRRIRAGSTLTCAVTIQNNLFWCSVGDSRLYLYRNGQMNQLNTEHNYKTMVTEKLRTGQMRPEEVDPNENPDALTSYLGMGQACQIDGNLSPVRLEEGDIIVQCSDGLYRSLSDNELAKILQQLPDLNIAAEAMTSMAVSIPGKHDNTSVILMRYKGTE